VNIYLDIETIPEGEPDLSSLPDPSTIVVLHDDPDIKVDGRLKDPAKIEAAREEGRAKLQEQRRAEAEKMRADALDEHSKGALTALRGRVLCVGIAVEEAGPKVLMADTEEETLELLQRGLEHYAKQASGRLRLWTWNGAGFDRPFLARRALRHRLYPLARRMRVQKKWEADDLYQAWSMGEYRAKGRLDDVCDLLGIGRADNPIDGSEVYDRYQSGDFDAIREHCLDDVRVLQLIGREFRAAGWLE